MIPRPAGTPRRAFALIPLIALVIWAGCSESAVSVKDPPAAVACADSGIEHSGDATYYTFADGGGNCMYDPTPDDLMVGAMNETEYDNSAICGTCAVVTGPEGQIRIRIVDRCAGCQVGGIDLSPEAFALIAEIARGRVPITWRTTPCEVTGPIVYHFKPESNQWWTSVQVRNHRSPIARLEYRAGSGSFVEAARSQYNYFIEPGGMGPGPFTFRVTDIHGHVLEDQGIIHRPGGDSPGAAQFPPCIE